jgi:hypothetical protein
MFIKDEYHLLCLFNGEIFENNLQIIGFSLLKL